jgi:membrane-bound lytic murein transglycosylase D
LGHFRDNGPLQRKIAVSDICQMEPHAARKGASETLTGIREGDVIFFEIRRTGMAPDSRFWRRQLGEASPKLQSNRLKPTLFLCFILVVSSTSVNARTEFANGTSNADSFPTMGYEGRVGAGIADQSQPASLMNLSSSPAGRWNNRIQIHIPHHPAIERYVRYYNGQGKSTMLEAMEKSWPYIPVMADILRSYGVPPEFVCVVMVESSFKRRAQRLGARGYWQLLASTARSMGLRVDGRVDERLDPVKSTRAAARYLRSFYDEYHCWSLALAAYNAGNGPVERLVKKHRLHDFWDLYKYGGLPRLTRAYVPKVLAAIQVMRDLQSEELLPQLHYAANDFDPIWVSSPLKLEQVARWINVPLSDLQKLNSSLSKDQVPPDSGYMLNLPSGYRDKFDIAYEDYLRKH